jgi:hypothetical protein
MPMYGTNVPPATPVVAAPTSSHLNGLGKRSKCMRAREIAGAKSCTR